MGPRALQELAIADGQRVRIKTACPGVLILHSLILFGFVFSSRLFQLVSHVEVVYADYLPVDPHLISLGHVGCLDAAGEVCSWGIYRPFRSRVPLG